MPQDCYRFIEDGENYDVALVRSAELGRTQFPKQLLAIARAGAGVNNIPVDRCSEEGIVVFNTPGANANAVKELVLCGMMLACRRIVPGIQWVQRQHDEGPLMWINGWKRPRRILSVERSLERPWA